MRNSFIIVIVVMVCVLLAPAASAATFVNGFVPDWNQPNWHGANGPNGGPAAPAWGAWCVPTAAATLIGHWEDARGVAISDGAAYNASGVAWPNWPAYQDYQANGAATRGALSPGAADGLGWYLDTNNLGDPAQVSGAHAGTQLGEISNNGLGFNKFFSDRGGAAANFTAVTHGLGYADAGSFMIPNLAAGFAELTAEVNANRTALAHFLHWNLQFFGAGPGAGALNSEADYGFDYYTFGSFTFPGSSDEELDEDWNGRADGEGLGHTATVVGYIVAGAQDDPLAGQGGQNWLIVHDNWSVTPRNVAVPFGAVWTGDTLVVPEPGTIALMALGVIGLVRHRRRRR